MRRLVVSRGDVFGRLTVLEVNTNRKTLVKCLCSCGSVVVKAASDVLNGDTRSCGCLRREISREIAKKHLKATHRHTANNQRSAEYVAWNAMRRRCLPSWPKRHLYFDRGISVCAEWDSSFEAFLAAVGPKPLPSFSLDRLDNNKGYEPGNVRWADLSTQRNNQRPRGKYRPRRTAVLV